MRPRFLLTAVTAFVLGCSGDDGEPDGGYRLFEIAGPTEIGVGETGTFRATVLNELGKPTVSVPITWSSTDENVAIVIDSGADMFGLYATVQGQAVGATTIVATTDGARDTQGVTVINIPAVRVAATPGFQ